MKQTEPEKTLQADENLDAVLARMAEETPPMPADFHERWMDAVRAEAGEAAPAADEKPRMETVPAARWGRIISIAAVFVFLIGGTVLYRNSRRSLTAAFRAEKESAVIADIVEQDAAEPLPAEAAPKTGFLSGVPETGGIAANGDGGAVPGEALSAAPETAEEESDEAYDFAETSEAVPAATGMPTEPVPAAAAALLDTAVSDGEEPEAESASGFPEHAGTFLVDMGDFLLAALPYLAVLAVPAAVSLAIRRRKRKAGKM